LDPPQVSIAIFGDAGNVLAVSLYNRCRHVQIVLIGRLLIVVTVLVFVAKLGI
jgi:hypothetical protein